MVITQIFKLLSQNSLISCGWGSPSFVDKSIVSTAVQKSCLCPPDLDFLTDFLRDYSYLYTIDISKNSWDFVIFSSGILLWYYGQNKKCRSRQYNEDKEFADKPQEYIDNKQVEGGKEKEQEQEQKPVEQEQIPEEQEQIPEEIEQNPGEQEQSPKEQEQSPDENEQQPAEGSLLSAENTENEESNSEFRRGRKSLHIRST